MTGNILTILMNSEDYVALSVLLACISCFFYHLLLFSLLDIDAWYDGHCPESRTQR